MATCRAIFVRNFRILCIRRAGSISLKKVPEKHVTDARFMSRSMTQGLKVLPTIIAGQLWDDMADGFVLTRYLGMTHL